jgi:hypothetical protein
MGNELRHIRESGRKILLCSTFKPFALFNLFNFRSLNVCTSSKASRPAPETFRPSAEARRVTNGLRRDEFQSHRAIPYSIP